MRISEERTWLYDMNKIGSCSVLSITTLPLFPGVANCFRQQASESARISIPCCFSSTCTIIFSVDFGKYFIMFPCFSHAFNFKVHYRDLKSALQKNIDRTYPYSLFWGTYVYHFGCKIAVSNFLFLVSFMFFILNTSFLFLSFVGYY